VGESPKIESNLPDFYAWFKYVAQKHKDIQFFFPSTDVRSSYTTYVMNGSAKNNSYGWIDVGVFYKKGYS
jgi:hypothetical protein